MTIWHGLEPGECDVCHNPITDKFYDAALKTGTWGIFCPGCFQRLGLSTGTGRGQQFEKQTNGHWLKTAG